MRVVFDTNVALDAMLLRREFAGPALRLLDLAARGRVVGLLCATSVTTIHYIGAQSIGSAPTRKRLEELLSFLEVAPVDRKVLASAFGAGFRDFEDAVVHESGRHAGAEAVVTRDGPGFRAATLRIYEPGELVRFLGALPGT